MLKFLNYNNQNSLKSLQSILNKRKFTQKNKTLAVKKIISSVKKDGDKAVIRYEKKFSNIKVGSVKITFSKKEINEIAKKTNKTIKNSIDLAFNRIKKFHSKQKFLSFNLTENSTKLVDLLFFFTFSISLRK